MRCRGGTLAGEQEGLKPGLTPHPGAALCSRLHALSTAALVHAWPEATEKAAAKAEYLLSPYKQAGT